MNAKRLEVLREALPKLARIGVLVNPDNPAMVSILRKMGQTAQALGVKLWHIEVRRLDEFEATFTSARAHVEAAVVLDDGLIIANRARVADLAVKNRLK